MREVLKELVKSLDGGRPVAYCRLVETRGSTPQKAGAMMLVYGDGSQSGTLGGGCVEAEVKRRALAIQDAGRAEIARFQLDSDYGWDDGLICGGRMNVLIDPVNPTTDASYYRALWECVDVGEGIQEAVVFDADAAHLPEGMVLLLDEDNRVLASQRGELGAHDELLDRARPLSSRPQPYATHGVSYLPTLPRCRLVIVGGGHVGRAVAELSADLDFDIWIVDDREEFVREERFPRAQRRIHGLIDQTLPALDIDADTYCLIVTRGHNHDERALYYLITRGARYVGLIGSRRKIKLIFDDLLAEGISPELLASVYAPVGLDIGSQTVPEIAVSICAELISHRNRQGVVPGRPEKVPVSAETGN